MCLYLAIFTYCFVCIQPNALDYLYVHVPCSNALDTMGGPQVAGHQQASLREFTHHQSLFIIQTLLYNFVIFFSPENPILTRLQAKICEFQIKTWTKGTCTYMYIVRTCVQYVHANVANIRT